MPEPFRKSFRHGSRVSLRSPGMTRARSGAAEAAPEARGVGFLTIAQGLSEAFQKYGQGEAV
jgi:hypothetical protein